MIYNRRLTIRLKVAGKRARVVESPIDDISEDLYLRLREAQRLINFDTSRFYIEFILSEEIAPCLHDWVEQSGEPPTDVCFHCGATRS